MVGSEKMCVDCGYTSFRPRGALARTLYNKQIADRHLAHMDYNQWYVVDQKVLKPEVKSLFLQLSLDGETEEFLNQSSEKSDNIFLQIFYSLAKLFLGLFMSQTSINGFLGRGSMFVWSTDQFQRLTRLSRHDIKSNRCLLDLGAGDGTVTQIMEPFFHCVHVTEVSKPMKSQLASKGFLVLEEREVQRGLYDAVSCLNVLDRCDKPNSMIDLMYKSLKSDGIAIVALVLPFQPYVESGREDKLQSEDVNITGQTFEEQVNSLVTEVFPRAGFKVLRWTRLPYLCEGDLSQAFYWLDDVVFVLTPHRSKALETSYPVPESNMCSSDDIPANASLVKED